MLLLCDVVEKFTTLTKLGDQEANSVGFPGFKKLDNIWMVQRSQDTYLILKGLIVSYS
jgi:hypothetical protein